MCHTAQFISTRTLVLLSPPSAPDVPCRTHRLVSQAWRPLPAECRTSMPQVHNKCAVIRPHWSWRRLRWLDVGHGRGARGPRSSKGRFSSKARTGRRLHGHSLTRYALRPRSPHEEKESTEAASAPALESAERPDRTLFARIAELTLARMGGRGRGGGSVRSER